MGYIITTANGELYHHGIKGQKWGVRRYRNEDGSLTEAGKRREAAKADSNRNKKIAARIGLTVAATTAAAAGAYYLSKKPDKIMAVVNKAKNLDVKSISKNSVERGRQYVKNAALAAKLGAKEGIREGLKEGPRKLTKTVVTGAVMVGGYKALEKAVGKKTADQVFSANDPKKISKFYKNSGNNQKDEEDD